MRPFDFRTRPRVVFGEGALERLGELASALGFSRTLLVADAGLFETPHVARAAAILRDARVEVSTLHDFSANPDARMVEAGRVFAVRQGVDSIVGLGGGSSLDCAKGINFVLSGGGTMADYQGTGKVSRPMLPMIGVPTTAGTGSEAQCYALISDPDTHVKMACGDPKAAFRVAILDPTLTVSQPPRVTAAAGYDAIAHAVETYVTTSRNNLSELFSREAWRLLNGHFEHVLNAPGDLAARAAMQLGAYYAGVAIELSMLGATHACANPLTARYGATHGEAIAVLLPHVVRWNAALVGNRYGELLGESPGGPDAERGEAMAVHLARLAAAAGLPKDLRAFGVPRDGLAVLSEEAGAQWTGAFNPRPFDAAAAGELYTSAF